jgi:hypothetical protein
MSIEEFIISVFCLIDDQLESLLNAHVTQNEENEEARDFEK